MANEKTPSSRAVRRERKLEKQLIWIAVFVVFLIALYFVSSYAFKQLNSFYYKGLRFTKENYGNGTAVYHHYYYYNSTNGRPIQYNLYLLTDPRENNIPIEGDPIKFTNRGIYITIDNSYPSNCSDNLAALVDLVGFVRDNGFAIIPGYMNRTYARQKDTAHIECSLNHNWEVIEFIGGNTTRVDVKGNCHIIQAGPECRIQQAVEKFKVQAILDAKNWSSSGL